MRQPVHDAASVVVFRFGGSLRRWQRRVRMWLAIVIVLASMPLLAQDELPPEPPPIDDVDPPAATVVEPPAENTSDEPALPDAPQTILTGELPWSESIKHTRKLPAQRLRNARQMLEMYGLDDSQWLRLEDDRPLVESEHELLYKILFRLPRFLLEDIERWQHHDPDWSEVASEVRTNRGEMYLLKGTAVLAEKVEMIPELATLYEFDHYYRVSLRHDGNRTAFIYTRRIPSKWPLGKPMEQRAQVSGMLLKVGEASADESSAPMIFAAQRAAWYPQKEMPALGVTPDRVLLSSVGMDLALLDDVSQRTTVGARDRECFYQMIHAMRRANADELASAAGEERGDVIPLFQKPEEQIGELMTFVGTARRISKVECAPDIRRRIGLSHYYQVDVFVPLDNERIRLGRKEDTAEGEVAPVFENNYPFTLCVATLPDGLEETREMNEPIRFHAYFFKLWTYNTAYMKQFDKQKKQIGPMMIGKSFSLNEPPGSIWQPYMGGIFGALFVAALGTIWLSLWRNSKADINFQRTTLSKSYETPDAPSLNEMGIEEAGQPDFSKWGEAEKD